MADIYDEEDRRRALTQGLLGAGLAMLGARKGSEYNAFAQAGLLGLGGFNRSLEGSTEARDRKAQRDMQGQQWAMTKAEHELKLKELQDAQAQKQRLGGVYADMPVNMPQAGVAPATAAQFGPSGGDTTGLSGMPPAPVTQPSPFDQYIAKARYFEQAARKFPQDAEMLMAQAEKQYAAAKDWRDQNEGDVQFVRGPDGKMIGIQRKKYGNPQELPGYLPKPNWSMQDTGGSIQPVDLSGATTPQVMPKTMTYGDKNSAARLSWEKERAGRDDDKPTWDAVSGQLIYRGKNGAPSRAETPTGFVRKADKPTDPQLAAQGFHMRMTESSKILDGLEKTGYVPGIPGALVESVKSVPYAGALPGALMSAAGAWMMPQSIEYKQAQADWVRAKLRKESGAVIGPKEMEDEIITYFPQANDPPSVILQKANARKIAERAMYMQARGVGSGQEDPMGIR